jgi:hypothetical protein
MGIAPGWGFLTRSFPPAGCRGALCSAVSRPAVPVLRGFVLNVRTECFVYPRILIRGSGRNLGLLDCHAGLHVIHHDETQDPAKAITASSATGEPAQRLPYTMNVIRIPNCALPASRCKMEIRV